MAVPSRLPLACLALLVGTLVLLGASPASAQDLTGFTVTGTMSIERTTLTVDGPIRVASGGSLTLRGVDLTLAPSATERAALVVDQGAFLTLEDSTIRAAGNGPGQAVRVELRGQARVERSSFYGLALDNGRAAGPWLEAGTRIVAGGLLVYSSDVLLDTVVVKGSVGCGLTVYSASPMLRGLDVSTVAYAPADGSGYAAGLCIKGGSTTVEGLQVSGIGSSAAGDLSTLTAAGLVADHPAKLTLLGLEARNFAPALAGRPAPRSIALAVQGPGSLEVRGGRIEGATEGIVVRGSATPEGAGSMQISQMAIVDTVSGPINVVGAYTTDPAWVWSDLQISSCGGNGLYFESQNAGTPSIVTATVSNVTVTLCSQSGIQLYDNGAQGQHNFAVWSSNTTFSGQHGFHLHGVSMGAGLNIQMADNGAWNNTRAGIWIETTYAAGGAKIASSKLERNTADANTARNTGSQGGGIIQLLGAPTTMSLRYIDNTARGNGNASGLTGYGHYIQVAVTNGLAIGTGWFTHIVAEGNSHAGFGIFGGAGIVSRFDQARIRDSRIVGQPTGIVGSYARVEIWNSTMDDSAEFQGQATTFIAVGTVHRRGTGTTDGTFFIRSYKLISIHGVWQNGAPLYMLPLTFISGTNNSAAPIYGDVSVDPPTGAGNRQTDANGNWSGWVLDSVFDPQQPAANQKVDYAPLTISVQLFETSARSDPFNLNTNVLGDVLFTDPNPPTLILSSPRENTTYTRANLTIQGSVTDDLSGVAGLEVSIDGVNWVALAGPYGSFTYSFVGLAEGVYDVYIRSWDKASDLIDPRAEMLVVLYSIGIDTTPPVLGIVDPDCLDGGEVYTSSTQLLFRGNVDRSVEQLYVNGQTVNLTGTAFLYLGMLPNEGPQTFLFLAIDLAGNARNVTCTVFRDTVDPTLILLNPSGRGEIFWPSRSILVEGITDVNVKVTIGGVPAPVNGSSFSLMVSLQEGRNTILILAIDLAGNQATRTLVVTADTIAPTITILSLAEGAFLGSPRLELIGELSEPVALFEVNLRIFAVSGISFDAVLGLSEGPNLISVNATDRAGNVGRATRHLTVDTIPPGMTLNSLPDFLVIATRQLSVSGTITEEATVTVEGNIVDVAGFEFSTSLTLVEGLNTLAIVASDRAGNTVTLIRRVTVDTTQPTVTISEPAPGAGLSSRTFRIVGSAEPNSTVQVGGQFVTTDASGHFTAWISLEGDGPQTIRVNVTDAAGNTAGKTFTVTFAPVKVDTSGALTAGLIAMVGLAAGVGVGTRFLVKRRVDGKVAEARKARDDAAAQEAAMPGYAEAPAPAAPEQGAPEAGAYAAYQEPYAPAEAEPQPESAPAPPRPPRPPRPPTA